MTVASNVTHDLAVTRREPFNFNYRLLGTGTNVAVTLKVSVLWLQDVQRGTMYHFLSSLLAFCTCAPTKSVLVQPSAEQKNAL